MLTKTVKVENVNGLHVRVAGKIAGISQKSSSTVSLYCLDCEEIRGADGCSLLQMLLLEATKGNDIQITVDGKDEKKVIRKIEEVFSNGAGI